MNNYWLEDKKNKWILSIPSLDLVLEVEAERPKANIIHNPLVATIKYYEWLPIAVKFNANHSEGMVNFGSWIFDGIKGDVKKCSAKLEFQNFESNKTESWFMEGMFASSASVTQTNGGNALPFRVTLKFDSIIYGAMTHKTNTDLIED